ncbi:BsSco [Hartmannibacter diazotrophicus]|uniref:BsSco n=1 Tax=Hartmannibacter diazotrophicus TaxID=1482074 RepID=A0A2C9D9L7_9HYPH|nr:SCO family protein [Hartmannibacter diazotrophicus]SON56966.1 BsSco [Hartmannibacter diazotrophicus]
MSVRPRTLYFGIAWGLVAIMTAVLAYAVIGTRAPDQKTGVAIGGPFTLEGAGGKPVTDKDLAGKPFAIFFGYTHCPDVCPTTLAEMDAARDELGDLATGFTVVFVSVDYERDTPDSLQSYVGSFKYPVIGLTGTKEQIEAIGKEYRVYYEKIPGEDGDYTMNHTASVYLMDGKGRFKGTVNYNEDHDNVVAKLKRLAENG